MSRTVDKKQDKVAGSIYRHEFTVTGRGRFPMDMLRYDACYPRDGEAVVGIEVDWISKTYYRALRTVRLVHYGPYGWSPTEGRWSSFLWGVNTREVR